MPVAAAVQPEVLPRDPHPLEVLRGGEHRLDELAVLLLDPRPLDQGRACLGDAVREAVANHLQLAQVEDPRGGDDGVDPVRHLGVAERLAEQGAEVGLEPGDLAAQLEPCLALVDRDARSWKRLIE